MTRAWCLRGQALADEIGAARPVPNELYAWYIGQVGYVFKGQVTVCVDPFLNDLASPDGVSKRLYQPPFAPDVLLPDYVLCTHGHDDHLALPTLTAMAKAGKKTRFVVPAGCVELLADAGIPESRVIGLTAKQTFEADGLVVRPVQAAHPVHETDARGRDLALCLSLRMNGVELLHLGDTYLTDQLLDDLKQLPRPDVFFTPINGGDYFRTARNCIGNLNALEAAKLSNILRARLAVPTHFDTMIGNTVDPFEFVRCLWDEDPAARFRIPALGECLRFRAQS